MDFLVGSDASITFRFDRRGEPTTVTAGSAKYTLLDETGLPIAGQTDVALTVGPASSSVTINIPASANATTQRIGKRFLRVSYAVNGESYSRTLSYRLVPFLTHTVTPDAVRAELGGIGRAVLADDAIDLVRAYLTVEDKVSKDKLDATLVSGTLTEFQANDAIRWQAALDLLNTVRMRLTKKETDGAIGFERFDLSKSFGEVEDALRQKLLAAINTLSGRSENAYGIITFATPTDPVTGS